MEFSNGSEASGEEHPFSEWPEESQESKSYFSHEKKFTIDLVFTKQNARVVTFGNDISELHRVLTIKHSASQAMLD